MLTPPNPSRAETFYSPGDLLHESATSLSTFTHHVFTELTVRFFFILINLNAPARQNVLHPVESIYKAVMSWLSRLVSFFSPLSFLTTALGSPFM